MSDYDKAPTDPHHGGKLMPHQMPARIRELEAALETIIEEKAALVVENERLHRALDIYERERARFRHAKPEMTGAYFLAGGHGPKDDNHLPQFVEICPAYGCGWVQIYEDTGRTISTEGS